MKMRVESSPAASLNCHRSYYRFKVWEAAQDEPSAWDMAGCGKFNEPTNGSLLLVAHHVDASFGNVAVTPLAGQASAAGFAQLVSDSGEGNEIDFNEKPPLEGGIFIEMPEIVPDDGAANAQAGSTSSTGSSPQIDLWYGSSQQFGNIGQPIEWIKMLGNVSGQSAIISLSYRLNGGSTSSLTLGPDSRRLADSGDFNIELPFSALADAAFETGSHVQHTFTEPGVYTVQLTVIDDTGASHSHTSIITVHAS